MAPPANRRSGHSRRAQYGTFFGYVAGVLGALVGAMLLVVSFRNPGAFSGARSAAADAAEPAGLAAARTRKTGRDIFGVLEGYVLAGSRFDATRRELAIAKARLAETAAIKAENLRLKRLLKLAESDPRPVVVTRLAGSSASSSRRYGTLDAGSERGVMPGMPVRSILGLVGRVLETGTHNSRILLLTDSDSMVPVRRAGDDVSGLAQGRGDGKLKIRLNSLGINPLREGDVLVTSGAGGIYRMGIPVAVVEQLTSDGAIAQVLSDPAAADYVMVDPIGTVAAP